MLGLTPRSNTLVFFCLKTLGKTNKNDSSLYLSESIPGYEAEVKIEYNLLAVVVL